MGEGNANYSLPEWTVTLTEMGLEQELTDGQRQNFPDSGVPDGSDSQSAVNYLNVEKRTGGICRSLI